MRSVSIRARTRAGTRGTISCIGSVSSRARTGGGTRIITTTSPAS